MKQHEIVDFDAAESVSERVARLITHQAGAKGCSLPNNCNIMMTCQSHQLSARSRMSAGSVMRSGSQPPKHKLKSPSFADALTSPTHEEKKVREQVEA